MGNRGPTDPYNDGTTLVDKMIGNAYQIVKYVACNLDDIKVVARYFRKVGNQKIESTLGGLGSTTDFVMTGVDDSQIISVNALVRGSDNVVYFPDGVNIIMTMSDDKVHLRLGAAAPSVLIRGKAIVTVAYNFK